MKSLGSYGILAEKYDIYSGADYDKYNSFLNKAFEKSDIAVNEVLDLGCGTGELSVRLAEGGKSVTAVDISEDMLSVLIGKIGGRDILPVCQDMRCLDLFGTVQGCVSAFDCLNYMQSTADFEKAISSVGFFMEKGGIFVFDVNTDYTYKSVYDGRSYVYEDKGDMLIWQSVYNPKSRLCRFYLTSFEEENGLFVRYDDIHIQKNHTEKAIKSACEKAGFEICGIYGDLDFSPPGKESRKSYYILKKSRNL